MDVMLIHVITVFNKPHVYETRTYIERTKLELFWETGVEILLLYEELFGVSFPEFLKVGVTGLKRLNFAISC